MTEDFPPVESINVMPDAQLELQQVIIRLVQQYVGGALALRRLVRIAQETVGGSPLTFLRAVHAIHAASTLGYALYPGLKPNISVTKQKQMQDKVKKLMADVVAQFAEASQKGTKK